jgi:hypothetical protein
VLAATSRAEGDWDLANDRVRLDLAIVDSASMALSILPASDPTQVVIEWLESPLKLHVQTATQLVGSTSWTDATGTPVLVGGMWRMTNGVAGTQCYYRLKLDFPAAGD